MDVRTRRDILRTVEDRG